MSTTSPTQPEYRLADHVRACNVDGQVILLDLQRGKYIGTGGPLLSALASKIADWPVDASDEVPAADDGIDRWIGDLRQQGLLVGTSAPMPERAALPSPLDSLSHGEHASSSGVQWRRLACLGYSAAITTHWLRRHSLATIARKVLRLRAVQSSAHVDGHAGDLRRASAWYLRSRPLVITAHDKCLHDSLTLLRFLAFEKQCACWVVGVRTRPFAAHSWVQSGSLVLNDTHEYVRGFTPILVV